MDGTPIIRRRPDIPEINDYAVHLKRNLTQAKQKGEYDLYKRMRYAVLYEILQPLHEGRASPYLKRFRESATYKLYLDNNTAHERVHEG